MVSTDTGKAARQRAGTAPFGVFILLAGAFMPIMDFFITNVALPSVDASLRASAPELELVVAGYGVAYAALLVLGGRLGDRCSRHRMFAGGLIGFTLASLACGPAPSAGVLIVARIVQGAAAALLMPHVLATFNHTLEGERKAPALALYGATSGLAAVVGQILGLLVSADIRRSGQAHNHSAIFRTASGAIPAAILKSVTPNDRS
jgi:MFS family permease